MGINVSWVPVKMKILASRDNMSRRHCQIAGTPLESSLPNRYSNVVCGRGNTPAYGKNVKNVSPVQRTSLRAMGNLQLNSHLRNKEERCSTTKWQWGGNELASFLRYSLIPHKSVLAPLKKARTYDSERKFSEEVGRNAIFFKLSCYCLERPIRARCKFYS